MPSFWYVSLSGCIRSPKYTCPSDTWKHIRWTLETNNGSFTNNCTYLTASYDVARKNVLLENDIIPDVFYVCRNVFLPGHRSMVPATAFTKYNVLQHEYDQLKQRETEYTLHEMWNSINPNDHPILQQISSRLQSLETILKSFEQKENVHPSNLTLPVACIEMSKDPSVSHISTYFVPNDDYICTQCFRKGHHVKQACYMFEREKENTTMKFGADKMRKFGQ